MAATEHNPRSPKKMRRVVLAKALVLIALSLYLAIGMGRAPRTGGDAEHSMTTAHRELLR